LGKLVGKPKEVPDLNGQVLKIGALEVHI